MKKHIINNNNVHLCCYDSEDDYGKIPLYIVPGMVNSGDEYIEDLQELIKKRRCIFMTLRGRKGSDEPEEGYSFYHHISDIDAIVQYFSFPSFHMYGHSVGGAYALGYALNYGMKGHVIIGDYPAYYPKFPEAWVQRIAAMEQQPIDVKIAEKIAEESESINLFERLNELQLPPILLYSSQAESLIKPEHIKLYTQYRPDIILKPLHKSGHSLISPSSEGFVAVLDTLL